MKSKRERKRVNRNDNDWWRPGRDATEKTYFDPCYLETIEAGGDLDRRALTIVNRWDDKGTQPCPAWRAREEGELEEGGARERYIDHQEESSSLLGRGKRSGK